MGYLVLSTGGAAVCTVPKILKMGIRLVIYAGTGLSGIGYLLLRIMCAVHVQECRFRLDGYPGQT
jgi:hypothetical protein